MTVSEAIKILRNEIACVKRTSCNRKECANCDLVMVEQDILDAYEMAIDALQSPWYVAEPFYKVKIRNTQSTNPLTWKE